jgi:hypothetical protein
MKQSIVSAAICLVVSQSALAQTQVPADPLATPPGWQIGAQLSDYRYEEPTLGVKIWGPRVGITGAYTFVSAEHWFLKVDGRFAYGSLKYEGSGTQDSIPDSIFETRVVLGKDYLPGGAVSLSPYAGLGYRNLYNDARGASSTGAIGYQRYSNYLYAPVGLTLRTKIASHWVIAPTIEYDYFIKGRQDSQLTDTGLGLGDASNKQDKGYGYRLSLMAENGAWAFGPWMQYWRIEDSDIVPVGFGFGAQEPQNETREYGLEMRYRF